MECLGANEPEPTGGVVLNLFAVVVEGSGHLKDSVDPLEKGNNEVRYGSIACVAQQRQGSRTVLVRLPAGISLICLRPELISISSPGPKPSMAV